MAVGSSDNIDKSLVLKYKDEVTVSSKVSNLQEDKSFMESDYNLERDLGDDTYTKIKSDLKDLKIKNKKLTSCRLKSKKNVEKLHQEITDIINPNKMYERLGIDILSIVVAPNLIHIAKSEETTALMAEMVALRYKMVDKLGFILPCIRVMDSSLLEGNTYTINVRGKEVFKGEISEEDIENNNSSKIIDNLYKICMQYAHQIMTKTDALKLMELIRTQDPTLVNDLVPMFLSPIDLKHIFANLCQAKVGIKDIVLVFEILNDYSRYTQNRNKLTEILIKELSFNRRDDENKI